MIQIKNYSEEDLKFLVNNYHTMTMKDLSLKLDKSIGSISNAARKLGLIKQIHKPWTDEDNQYLINHYIEKTSEEIAKYLGRTVASVNTQRDRLGLVRHEAWIDNEIQFLKDNYLTMEHLEIGKVLHRTDSAVRAKCFELDLYKKEKPWEEWECDFIKNNYREMSKAEIAEILNRSCDAIQCRASKLGIKKSPYYCNYHFFDVIDTEEKAYWLGFLMADGWIGYNTKNKSGVVGVELQYADIDHLRKLNKSLNGNYRITDRWRLCNLSDSETLNHHCCLRLFSTTIYNALVDKGFTNSKSFNSHISDIPKELNRHFIRGYFDGNGTVSVSNQRVNVSFCMASLQMKNDLISTLHSVGIDICDVSSINENGVEIYRPEATNIIMKIKLLDYMYDNCTVYLNRKYKKYLKAKQKYAII